MEYLVTNPKNSGTFLVRLQNYYCFYMETTLLIRLRSFCTRNSVEGLLPISDVALIPKQSFINTLSLNILSYYLETILKQIKLKFQNQKSIGKTIFYPSLFISYSKKIALQMAKRNVELIRLTNSLHSTVLKKQNSIRNCMKKPMINYKHLVSSSNCCDVLENLLVLLKWCVLSVLTRVWYLQNYSYCLILWI